MEFSLAPLRGITGKEFRTALTHHYSGIDICVLPFFSITKDTLSKFKNFEYGFTEEELSKKCNYQVIPQLIGNNPQAIARVSKMFFDNGYPNVNLNLGCPMPQITKKKRGSGLLPYKNTIEEIFEEVFKTNGLKFSVKLRLGMKSEEDIFNLIEVLNKYPLDEIYIHPRFAVDRYEGPIHLDILDDLLPKISNNKVIYNGDITNAEYFNTIQNRYNSIDSFMIGRGLVANPALVEEIISGKTIDRKEKQTRFKEFYKELIFLLEKRTNDPLPRLKSYWQYFSQNFDNKEEIFRKMTRSTSIEEMRKIE